MATKIGEIWSDLDHRFLADGQGRLRKVVNIEAVLTSIDNILKTSQGERVMRPNFGSPLRGIVFENMDSDALQYVSDNIQQLIEVWDDRVKVNSITFFQSPDDNLASLDIKFVIRGHDKVFQYVSPVEENGGSA